MAYIRLFILIRRNNRLFINGMLGEKRRKYLVNYHEQQWNVDKKNQHTFFITNQLVVQ